MSSDVFPAALSSVCAPATIEMTVSAITEEGVFRMGLDPQLEVIEPDGTGTPLAVAQVGPGTYQAKYPLSASPDSPYLFRLSADDVEAQSRELFYPYADEYRLYPPNTELLLGISKAKNRTTDETPGGER